MSDVTKQPLDDADLERVAGASIILEMIPCNWCGDKVSASRMADHKASVCRNRHQFAGYNPAGNDEILHREGITRTGRNPLP